jgi:hypothetical protein
VNHRTGRAASKTTSAKLLNGNLMLQDGMVMLHGSSMHGVHGSTLLETMEGLVSAIARAMSAERLQTKS